MSPAPLRRTLALSAAATVGVVLISGAASAAAANPTEQVVLRQADLPGYSPGGLGGELFPEAYMQCFKTNALLAKAPVPIARTLPRVSSNATSGASFTQGSVAIGDELVVSSVAWYAASDAQAQSAFAALTSSRFTACIEHELTHELTGGVLGLTGTVTVAPLPVPAVLGEAGASRASLSIYDVPAGAVGKVIAYDLTSVRVGRMLALLETDSAEIGTPSVVPFPEAQRLHLVTVLAERMAAVQPAGKARAPHPICYAKGEGLPKLTLCAANAHNAYLAVGSGWRPKEKVDIYLDTAAGAHYIGTAEASRAGRFDTTITNFLSAITKPGDAQFASTEDYPVVAMGSKGDAATITDMTEADVQGGKTFTSKQPPTTDGGCAWPGFPISSSRETAVPSDLSSGLTTAGSSVTTKGAKPVTVKLASVNWYGAEEADFVPGGLQCQRLATMAREIRKLGFNSVRLPWSNAMFEQNPHVCTKADIHALEACIPPEVLAANPCLANPGESSLQIFAATVRALTRTGLMVILDNHGTDAAFEPVKEASGKNLDGLWWGGQYWDNRYGFGADPQARTTRWVTDWERMVNMFKEDPRVIGADLRNEPSETPYSCGEVLFVTFYCTPEWGEGEERENWLGAAERAGDAILAKDPKLLIFVEGTSYATDLSQAAANPVTLDLPGRAVYSAHDYPEDGVPPDSWGYLLEDEVAPVWIGEFGATVAKIKDAQCPLIVLGISQDQWLTCFREYVKNAGASWSWWAINGTESDGGIFHPKRTYYEREPYGLLAGSWGGEASKTLTKELQEMQG